MSTRLGVRRTAEVVSAVAREGPGGRTYYDIQTRVGGLGRLAMSWCVLLQLVAAWLLRFAILSCTQLR